MKHFKLIATALFMLILVKMQAQQSQTYRLTIIVKGLQNTKGNMSIGLYNNANGFPKLGQAFKDVEKKINAKTFSYTFDDIPAGTYAVALFQDENQNSKADKNLFGIPKEPYGFSNDASGTFGPPDFDEASFSLKGDKTIIINLRD